MESHRDEFVCVLAGYEREMGELFDMNPGLTDRVGFHIHFPHYSEEELTSIFESFAERNQFLLAEGVREAVSSAARRLRELPDFANARTMRRLFERAVIKHCTSGADGRVLTVSDVEDAMADDDMGERKGVVRREIGFR